MILLPSLSYFASTATHRGTSWTLTVLLGALFLQPAPLFGNNTELPVIYEGATGSVWDAGIAAFDESLNYESCVNDGGQRCPNVDWRWVDGDNGYEVLELD